MKLFLFINCFYSQDLYDDSISICSRDININNQNQFDLIKHCTHFNANMIISEFEANELVIPFELANEIYINKYINKYFKIALNCYNIIYKKILFYIKEFNRAIKRINFILFNKVRVLLVELGLFRYL